MKKVILILTLCFACVFALSAQDFCDTLKWKVSQTCYLKSDPSHTNFRNLGELQGAVINLDTLDAFSPGFYFTNISNDTFSAEGNFVVVTFCSAYTDTGVFPLHFTLPYGFYFGTQVYPNNTFAAIVRGEYEFLYMINTLEENGLDFEQIKYWKMIVGISYTSKDGYYSDSVIFAGADTAVFRIVRDDVSNREIDLLNPVSVFPNPAQTQFTVTHTENAIITLYNLVGQKVRQLPGKEENTVICTEDLPQGVYLLKVEKENAVLTKKVQIIR
jgi:hypothetical protein